MAEDELYHYGVKGMKWGVRKNSDRTSISTKHKAKKDAKEYEQSIQNVRITQHELENQRLRSQQYQ